MGDTRRADQGWHNEVAELCHEYRERVRSVIQRRVRDPDLVDDLIQETFLRAHRSWHTYDQSRPSWPWLRQIALNQCVDHHRRIGDRTAILLDSGELEDAGPVHDPTEEIANRLSTTMSFRLGWHGTPRADQAILLMAADGISYRTIAHNLGTSTEAIRSRLKRARIDLRDRVAAAEARVRAVIGLVGHRFLPSRLRGGTGSAAPSIHAVGFGMAFAALSLSPLTTPPARDEAQEPPSISSAAVSDHPEANRDRLSDPVAAVVDSQAMTEPAVVHPLPRQRTIDGSVPISAEFEIADSDGQRGVHAKRRASPPPASHEGETWLVVQCDAGVASAIICSAGDPVAAQGAGTPTSNPAPFGSGSVIP